MKTGTEFRSLQWRLAFRLSLVFVIGAAVIFGALYLKVTLSIGNLNDRTLQAQASDIARAMQQTDDGAVTVTLPERIAETYQQARGGMLYVIFATDGTVAAASSDDASRIMQDRLGEFSEDHFLRFEDAQAGTLYGFARPAGDFTIVVVQGDWHPDVLFDSLIREFVDESVWLVVTIALVVLAVGVVTVRTSLSPLRRLAARAAEIGPDQMDLRLPTEDLPTELLPMVTAVNLALDRLDTGFESQLKFTGDAAHGLRTPLAVLTARIDGLADGPGKVGLLGDVARINRLVDQLLRVARLDSHQVNATQQVDLRALAAEAIEVLGPAAVAQGRDPRLIGATGPVMVWGDHEALLAAVTNLVSNAINHTPPGTGIDIIVDQEGSLAVRDHGAGVPVSDRDDIFQRFWRGPQAGAGGSGLGLPIVKETMAAHNGSVVVDDAPGGGALFVLKFGPAASGPATRPSQNSEPRILAETG